MNPGTPYRVVATGRTPLFICKAIPTPHHQQQHPRKQADPSQLASLFKLRQQFQELSSKLHPLPEPTRFNCRSMSCELQANHPYQLETNPSAGGQRRDSKQRQSRSIKEYLRLAYKRSERDRKGEGYRLPQIRHGQPRQEESGRDRGELQKVATMKKILKKHSGRERQKFKSQQKQERDGLLLGSLSGWDSSSVQDF